MSVCLSGHTNGHIQSIFFTLFPLFRRLLVDTFNVLLGIFNKENTQ